MERGRQDANKVEKAGQRKLLLLLPAFVLWVTTVAAVVAVVLVERYTGETNKHVASKVELPTWQERALGDEGMSSANRQEEPTQNTLSVTQIVDSYTVRKTIPHDTDAFTQGLTFDPENADYFFESTGLRGQSDVRKVDIETGQVLQIRSTPSQYFGEGLAYFTESNNTTKNGRLIHITWTSRQGFILDAETLEVVEEFQFGTTRNEGWGITYNPTEDQFIVSDGSQYLHFWDRNLNELKRITVMAQYSESAQPTPVMNLNELEWDARTEDQPRILANVWQEDYIVAIDPETGHVVTQYDLSELSAESSGCQCLLGLFGFYIKRFFASGSDDVLNGIAISPSGYLWVTGKLWPKMYQIQFNE